MEDRSNTMTSKRGADNVIFAFDDFMNSLCDVSVWSAWSANTNARFKSFLGHLDQVSTDIVLDKRNLNMAAWHIRETRTTSPTRKVLEVSPW